MATLILTMLFYLGLPVLIVIVVIKISNAASKKRQGTNIPPQMNQYNAQPYNPYSKPQPQNGKLEALQSRLEEELSKEKPDVAKLKEINAKIKEAKAPLSQPALHENYQAENFNQNPAPAQNQIRAYDGDRDPNNEGNYNGLNAMLYIGSFLLVAAAGLMIGAAGDNVLKFVILIFATLIFYAGGMLLFKLAPHLAPAGKAFVGTSLAIFPFWGVALNQFLGLPADVSWMVTSIVGTIIYFTTAISLNNEVIAYFSFGFLFSMSLSFVPTMALPMIWFFLGLIIISSISMAITLAKPKWLPEIFEKVTDTTARYVTPLVLFVSFFVVANASAHMYSILFAVATIQYLILFIKERNLEQEVALRIMVHATLLVWVSDTCGGYGTAFAVAWATLAVAQAALSVLRVKTKEKTSVSTGNTLLGMSMAAIMLTPVMLLESSLTTQGMACLVGIFFVIGLSALMMAKTKATGWWNLIASCLAIAPLVAGLWVSATNWSAATYTAIYVILLFASLGAYAFLRKSKIATINELTIVTCAIFCAFALVSAISAEATVWGWLAITLASATFAALAGKPKYYEATIYTGAITICSGIDASLTTGPSYGYSADMFYLYTHICVFAFVAASIWKERSSQSMPRLITAYSILTFITSMYALSNPLATYPMIFLVEQVIVLAIGSIWRKKWMQICGIVFSVLAVLYYLRDLQYVWLTVIGLSLIFVVIWRLTAANRK